MNNVAYPPHRLITFVCAREAASSTARPCSILCFRARVEVKRRDREYASLTLPGRAVFMMPYLSRAHMCVAYIVNIITLCEILVMMVTLSGCL
jgi:hypothetical protein